MLGRLADRMLATVAPKAEASAANCSYRWYVCYCSRGVIYRKKCMYGCSGVPDHCYSCTASGAC
ncbi:hypothetical protein BJF79_46080 [Actinomadura sp. CNU-125]|uniref:hypothetical protein n=1 Tax=Actinomadura sp. CNU-125 TaxID=1904961 RepID=UPI0009639D06|nr:hypothetical protein [Actinomadura sp. CNU-125]OLT22922.1 hypothetical protein BJF79_46080 [Actinomadura sp. CNU-125]